MSISFDLEDLVKWEELSESLKKRFHDLWDALNTEIAYRKAADTEEATARLAEDTAIWEALKKIQSEIDNATSTISVIENTTNSMIETVSASVNGMPAHAKIYKGSDGNRYIEINYWSDYLFSSSSEEMNYEVGFPVVFSELPIVVLSRLTDGAIGYIDSETQIHNIRTSLFEVLFDSQHESGHGHRERLSIYAAGKY